jgi:hypothetical protein
LHRTPGGCENEVGLCSRDETFAKEALVVVGLGKIVELTEIVVPVTRARELLSSRRSSEEVGCLSTERIGGMERSGNEERSGREGVGDGERCDEIGLGEIRS